MARCIFSSFLPPSLALPGMGMKRAGFDFLFTLRMMAGPFQHFSSILDAWRYSVFVKLSEWEGFRGVQFADFQGALQLLNCSHLRERDKMLLRAILCEGVWNGFLLGQAQKDDVPCQFCGKRDGDWHLF